MELTKEQTEKLILDTYSRIRSNREEGYIVLLDDDGKLQRCPLNGFIKQPVDGMLYDLNRLDSVLMAISKDNKEWLLRLVNDLAMNTLIEYLYNENSKLKTEVTELKSNIKELNSVLNQLTGSGN